MQLYRQGQQGMSSFSSFRRLSEKFLQGGAGGAAPCRGAGCPRSSPLSRIGKVLARPPRPFRNRVYKDGLRAVNGWLHQACYKMMHSVAKAEFILTISMWS